MVPEVNGLKTFKISRQRKRQTAITSHAYLLKLIRLQTEDVREPLHVGEISKEERVVVNKLLAASRKTTFLDIFDVLLQFKKIASWSMIRTLVLPLDIYSRCPFKCRQIFLYFHVITTLFHKIQLQMYFT
jgi:hypothetical protein